MKVTLAQKDWERLSGRPARGGLLPGRPHAVGSLTVLTPNRADAIPRCCGFPLKLRSQIWSQIVASWRTPRAPTKMGLQGPVSAPQSECLLSLPSFQHRDKTPADVEEGGGNHPLEHHPSPGRGLLHGQGLRGKIGRRAARPGRRGQVPVPAAGAAQEPETPRALQTPPPLPMNIHHSSHLSARCWGERQE